MMRSFKNIAFGASVAFATLVPCATAHGAMLLFNSDLVTESAPSSTADHTVTFTTQNAVPAGGSIVLSFDQFFATSTFDYTDVDLAVATTTGGVYTDRTLAPIASPISDGVSVATGTTPSVDFTLNSTTGIAAGDLLQVRLGENATFDATGTTQLTNPTISGRSYEVDITTKAPGGATIDQGATRVAIVDPVTVGPVNTQDQDPPIVIASYPPNGLLQANTTAVELAIVTNKLAICRYDTSPGTPFASMPNLFSTTGSTATSTTVLTGFTNGGTFNFYIRCSNLQGVPMTDDYVVTFTIGVVSAPIGRPGEGGGEGGGFGNGNGSLGGGDFLLPATVDFVGDAPAGSAVTLLQDGVKVKTGNANANGDFKMEITGLERGTYTFALYAVDGTNLQTSIYSVTAGLAAGSLSTIDGIFLSPTGEQSAASDSSNYALDGASVPGSTVSAISGFNAEGDEIVLATTTAASSGIWQMSVPTGKVVNSLVTLRAFAAVLGNSLNNTISLSATSTPAKGGLIGDLNGDGKVNLVDFSILIFNWGTANQPADINASGKVDIADFSIMLFHWTG